MSPESAGCFMPRGFTSNVKSRVTVDDGCRRRLVGCRLVWLTSLALTALGDVWFIYFAVFMFTALRTRAACMTWARIYTSTLLSRSTTTLMSITVTTN